VEFGYKAQVLDNDDGVVLDHRGTRQPRRRPATRPAAARVITWTGRCMRTVTADRGYGEAAVEKLPA
jgi:transposase, IS5 family